MPKKTIYKNDASGYDNIIGMRLKTEMKKNGISAAELARRSGVLTSFIYDIISGKSSNPSIIKLARVADSLNLNLLYLVHGELENNPAAREQKEEKYISIPYIRLNNSKNTNKNIISFKEDEEPYRFNAQWLHKHFNANINSLRMFTINGDSMQPAICHNDVVMLDISQKSPSPAGIFIVFDGMGISAKRLEYVFVNDSQNIRVISDNPRYSTYERLASDVSVVGRVVWFSREI